MNDLRIFRFLASIAVLSLLLAGCSQIGQIASEVGLSGLLPQPTATDSAPTGAENIITPTPAGTLAPASTPTGPQPLTIWVPPELAPSTEAGAQLQDRLEEFADANPGVTVVNVRVKAVSGQSSLLESLSVTASAAPSLLPSLIALPRADLEMAALKGNIYSLDELTTSIDDQDWYPYAQQLALIQGSVYGMPFGGDAMLLVYRPAKIETMPVSWDVILEKQTPLLFPVADPQAVTTLALYQSAGGAVQDAQNHPVLDAAVLNDVFTLYNQGAVNGTFPLWLSEIQNDGQAWENYQEGNGNWIITWSSRYLSELPVDATAVPIPSLGEDDFTLASGWLWALSDPLPERQALSASLAEFLVESDFLAEWSATTHYLPTRPTSLNALTNQSMKSLLSQLALSAQVCPANDLTASLGPILQESTSQIINRTSSPEQEAQKAVEQLAPPETGN